MGGWGRTPFFFTKTSGSFDVMTARNLAPSSVGVMMAVGDSISLGWAEEDVPVEYQGHSFSLGGDAGETTLFNLFKTKGGALNVTGASRGVRVHNMFRPSVPCDAIEAAAHCHLNAALDGARVSDTHRQLDYLNRTLMGQYSTHVDDWKVLTVFVGLSDAVFSYDGSNSSTPVGVFYDSYVKMLLQILSLNRIFVNVLLLPEKIAKVRDIMPSRSVCNATFRFTHGRHSPVRWTNEDGWRDTIVSYNRAITRAVHATTSPRLDAHLSIKGFLVKFEPSLDLVEHIDCFHPNRRMRIAMAVSLWNSMIGFEAGGIDPSARAHLPNASTVLQ
jgi:hypothetical protein